MSGGRYNAPPVIHACLVEQIQYANLYRAIARSPSPSSLHVEAQTESTVREIRIPNAESRVVTRLEVAVTRLGGSFG